MSHYRKGRALEHAVRHYFESMGFFVVRSAGSKTRVDLVVLQMAHGLQSSVLFLQCKSGRRCSNREAAELWKLSNDYAAIPYVAEKINGSSKVNVYPVVAARIDRSTALFAFSMSRVE